MSRLPAILNAIMRKVDAPPQPAGDGPRDSEPRPEDLGGAGPRSAEPRIDEPRGADLHSEVLRKISLHEREARATVFNLVPPAEQRIETPEPKTDEIEKPEPAAEPAAGERNVRPVGTMDLTRLSIDNDGRLYWDGKPVEVRRRIMMSRAQIAGAYAIGIFVVIGAIGAAIQGTAAAHDWACRLGWIDSACALPEPPQQVPRIDIPA